MDETTFRPMRSALYLPASNPRAIEKSRTLPADILIFDLEDAVAPDAKPAARTNLVQAFAQPDRPDIVRRIIRINDVASSFIDEDLAAVAACRPDAVLLPKVGSSSDLERYAEKAARYGVNPATTLWCMIESVPALLRLEEIAATGSRQTPRLECLVVGTNDIVRETRVSPANRRTYLLPWLMNIVLVAKQYGLGLLDGVWNDFRNLEGFAEEASQAADMGFDGKTLIHPSQIDPANQAFAPSPEEVAEARAIVAAFDDPGNAGRGAINLNGQMVELLHLEMARRALKLSRAIEQAAQRVR